MGNGMSFNARMCIAAQKVSKIPSGNGRHAIPYFFHQDWAKPAGRVGRRVAS